MEEQEKVFLFEYKIIRLTPKDGVVLERVEEEDDVDWDKLGMKNPNPKKLKKVKTISDTYNTEYGWSMRTFKYSDISAVEYLEQEDECILIMYDLTELVIKKSFKEAIKIIYNLE